MSESVNERDVVNPQTEVSPPLTLRQARERSGLHLAALAAMLKVPVKRLEALEAGRYDELPDMTFARALAQSVCRVLKVDPAPILANLPASSEVRLGDIDRSLNAPMPARHGALPKAAAVATPLVGRRLSWPMAFALLVLVVAVVLWFLLPAAPSAPTARVVSTPVPAAAISEPVTAEGDALGAGAQAGAEPVEPAVPDAGRIEPPAAAPMVPPTASAASTPAASAEPAASPAAEPEGLFRLRARETAWVQITGASGRVLVQRSLQPGEVVAFSNDFPLAVVVGRADEVEATLRGQPFALAPHARNNVARFEVR